MSDMSSQETEERWVEGLKQAASRCREMGIAQNNKLWDQIALSLDGIRAQGERTIRAKALSRAEQLAGVEAFAKTIKTD